MDRAQKDSELEYLNSCFVQSQIALCTNFRGLNVAQVTQLRNELRSNGSYARVVRNTLAKLSAEKAYKDADSVELGKFVELFSGPSLLVFSNEDPVSPVCIKSSALTK